MTPSRLLRTFRNVALAEGWSFLVLLLIAMPLKYFAGIPQAVTTVGWAHGVLFVAFLALAFQVYEKLDKPFSFLVKAFVASILPLGTFVLERQMRKDGDFEKTI